MLGITFGKKPIKENIKPSLCDYIIYIVQHRVVIAIMFIITFVIVLYMNHSSDSHKLSVAISGPIKLSVSNEIVHESVGQKVTRDVLLHQRHNPLEILANSNEKTAIDKSNKYHGKPSFLRHHGLKRSTHKKLSNITWKIRNSSMPVVADAYFTPIQFNITSNISYTDYQYNTLHELRSKNNRICDYLSIHGLEKSGTKFLEHILRIIANETCITQSKQPLSICNKSHIGAWEKHQALLPLHYSDLDVEKLYLQNEDLRFCVFTIFRDFRDRVISLENKGKYGSMQKYVLQNVRIFARKLKVWFNFYGNLEIQRPLEYFNLFYEDLVLNTQTEIEKMINYIGLHAILNENDIQHIMMFLDLDVMTENIIESEKSETICQMKNELSDETIQEIYTKIKPINVQLELLKKFNETCMFPHSFFDAEESPVLQ